MAKSSTEELDIAQFGRPLHQRPRNEAMSFLGETMKARRGQRNMSLQDVADEAQIAKNHVWELEQGRSRNPSVQTLLGLSVALDLDPCALAGLAFADLPGVVTVKNGGREQQAREKSHD